MSDQQIIKAYLALNEAGFLMAAARLSMRDKSKQRKWNRPENIKPHTLRDVLLSGNMEAIYRTEEELLNALHYAQSRQDRAQENREKIAAISPDLLRFIDECRAEGLEPKLLSITINDK